jgi:ubiquinone/menaquinone biosynthesis C-methylase UbiE
MKKETFQEDLYYLPYHWMMKGYLRVSMEFRNKFVLNYMNDCPTQKLLDLGCGDGYFTYQLRNKLPEAFVIGADYYLRALRFARIMTNDAPYVATSACDLGFKENSFDAVFLLDVLEHLNINDRKKALDQTLLVLKPGGVVIVTVPSKRLPVIPMHYDHFDIDTLTGLMEGYFVEVKITGCSIHLPILHKLTRFPVIWRIIYFTIRECQPDKAVTLIAYGKKAY